MAKILWVDEDAAMVQSVRDVLEKAGHSVDPALSAEDALVRLSQNGYDTLITDWHIGDENARRLIQAARKGAETLVVIVSGFVSEAFQAPDLAADLYLDKPVNPRELVASVDTLLKEKQGAIKT